MSSASHSSKGFILSFSLARHVRVRLAGDVVDPRRDRGVPPKWRSRSLGRGDGGRLEGGEVEDQAPVPLHLAEAAPQSERQAFLVVLGHRSLDLRDLRSPRARSTRRGIAPYRAHRRVLRGAPSGSRIRRRAVDSSGRPPAEPPARRRESAVRDRLRLERANLVHRDRVEARPRCRSRARLPRRPRRRKGGSRACGYNTGDIRGRPGFDVVGSPVELQAEVPGRPRKTTGTKRKCEERKRSRSRCLNLSEAHRSELGPWLG